LRNRTGPTVGSMLSAMQASVASIRKVARASPLAIGPTVQAGGSRYFKTESRLRPVPKAPIF
jgi:hypothetical protein